MNKKSFLTTKTFLLIMATILVGTAIYMFMVRSELNRLKDATNKRDQTKLKLLENDQKEELLAKAEQQYETIKVDLNKINLAIPQNSDTGLMIAAIEQIGNETGINISNINTTLRTKKVASTKSTDSKKTDDKVESAKPVSANKPHEEELLSQYHATVYSLTLTTSYPNLVNFLDRITNLDRYSILASLQLSNDNDNPEALTANVVFWTYHQNAAKEISNEKAEN